MKFIMQDADSEVVIKKCGRASFFLKLFIVYWSFFSLCIEHMIGTQPCFSPYNEQVFLIQSTKLPIISSLFWSTSLTIFQVLLGLVLDFVFWSIFYFLFAYYCGRKTLTKNAMVLTLVSELREGANSQCLFTTLLGTHSTLFSLDHHEVLDRHHRQEESPK